MNADSHMLPADVISRTGAPVSGITYSNYDRNPTAANRSSSNTQTTAQPEARGELIEATASLIRDDTIISPPVPSTKPWTAAQTPTTLTPNRGHPADEVGVRFWRETISPPASYSFTPQSSPMVTPEPVITSKTVETPEPAPEKAAFQQAEMKRWSEAARRDEQRRMDRQAEKEAFQKAEMIRWSEAARRDAHWKATKQSAAVAAAKSVNAQQSRKKRSPSTRNRSSK